MAELLATLFIFGRLVRVQLRQTEGVYEWNESQNDEMEQRTHVEQPHGR